MRTLITLAIVLLFAVVPAVAQNAADEAAVREASEQYISAHNKHDIKAMTALLDENWQNWTGARKGKEAHTKWQEERFEQSKDRQAKLVKDVGVDFITPDIAVHTFYQEMTGLVDEDGKAQPPVKGLSGRLYVRSDGQWLVRKWFWRQVEEIP